MLRAYQSPYSAADCGPQWAQMPNLASRNHWGISYDWSASTEPAKGPFAISGKVSCAEVFLDRRSAGAPAMAARTARRFILIFTSSQSTFFVTDSIAIVFRIVED